MALVNVTGARFNQETTDKFRAFVQANAPFIKYAAIFGVGSLQAVIYRAIVIFTGRANLKVCASEQEAKDFLFGVV